MNGIHEVTGSTPVWSTILRSASPSYGSASRVKDAAPKPRRGEGGLLATSADRNSYKR